MSPLSGPISIFAEKIALAGRVKETFIMNGGVLVIAGEFGRDWVSLAIAINRRRKKSNWGALRRHAILKKC